VFLIGIADHAGPLMRAWKKWWKQIRKSQEPNLNSRTG
jgi:hypothetical protein